MIVGIMLYDIGNGIFIGLFKPDSVVGVISAHDTLVLSILNLVTILSIIFAIIGLYVYLGWNNKRESDIIWFNKKPYQEAYSKNRYSNFSPSQLLQYTINSYHNNGAKFGWFRFPTISDKPNLPIVKMPKLNQADVIKGLHDVYKSESARMASGVIANEQYDNKKGLFILLPYLNSLSKEDI